MGNASVRLRLSNGRGGGTARVHAELPREGRTYTETLPEGLGATAELEVAYSGAAQDLYVSVEDAAGSAVVGFTVALPAVSAADAAAADGGVTVVSLLVRQADCVLDGEAVGKAIPAGEKWPPAEAYATDATPAASQTRSRSFTTSRGPTLMPVATNLLPMGSALALQSEPTGRFVQLTPRNLMAVDYSPGAGSIFVVSPSPSGYLRLQLKSNPNLFVGVDSHGRVPAVPGRFNEYRAFTEGHRFLLQCLSTNEFLAFDRSGRPVPRLRQASPEAYFQIKFLSSAAAAHHQMQQQQQQAMAAPVAGLTRPMNGPVKLKLTLTNKYLQPTPNEKSVVAKGAGGPECVFNMQVAGQYVTLQPQGLPGHYLGVAANGKAILLPSPTQFLAHPWNNSGMSFEDARRRSFVGFEAAGNPMKQTRASAYTSFFIEPVGGPPVGGFHAQQPPVAAVAHPPVAHATSSYQAHQPPVVHPTTSFHPTAPVAHPVGPTVASAQAAMPTAAELLPMGSTVVLKSVATGRYLTVQSNGAVSALGGPSCGFKVSPSRGHLRLECTATGTFLSLERGTTMASRGGTTALLRVQPLGGQLVSLSAAFGPHTVAFHASGQPLARFTPPAGGSSAEALRQSPAALLVEPMPAAAGGYGAAQQVAQKPPAAGYWDGAGNLAPHGPAATVVQSQHVSLGGHQVSSPGGALPVAGPAHGQLGHLVPHAPPATVVQAPQHQPATANQWAAPQLGHLVPHAPVTVLPAQHPMSLGGHQVTHAHQQAYQPRPSGGYPNPLPLGAVARLKGPNGYYIRLHGRNVECNDSAGLCYFNVRPDGGHLRLQWTQSKPVFLGVNPYSKSGAVGNGDQHSQWHVDIVGVNRIILTSISTGAKLAFGPGGRVLPGLGTEGSILQVERRR